MRIKTISKFSNERYFMTPYNHLMDLLEFKALGMYINPRNPIWQNGPSKCSKRINKYWRYPVLVYSRTKEKVLKGR